MADAKLTALTAIASVAAEDLFYVVDDPAGTPASTKATGTQVAAMVKTAESLLADLLEDTTPQLGGNLDLNTFDLELDSDTMFTFGAVAGTLTLYSTEAGAGSFGLDFHRDSATPADDDILASINFYGEDDGSTKTAYATIRAEAADVTNATEDGRLEFDIIHAGSAITALALGTAASADGNPGTILNLGSTDFSNFEILCDSTGTTGAYLSFYHNSSSPAANDRVGAVMFHGKDGAGNVQSYGGVKGYITDTTSTSEDGRIELDVTVAGAVTNILRVDGDGLKFFGDSAAANALDDYEEGSWTPTLTTTGTNFTSVTYDNTYRAGRYTKIGNTVHFWGAMWTDAVTVGSASGNPVIGGLPYTAASVTYNPISIGYTGVWNTNNPHAGYVNIAATTISLFYYTAANGASAQIAVGDVATGADSNRLYFAGTYYV